MLVLVSGSPRRADLLAQLGHKFRILRPQVDEMLKAQESAMEAVSRLAIDKVRWGQLMLSDEQGSSEKVLIGADTLVEYNGQILGKPDDRQQAKQMLLMLSGKTHKVVTGVAVCKGEIIIDCVVETLVTFRRLTTGEAEAYWQTGEPIDKAGGYAIQGKGAVFVASISGSYTNVVGLPLMETAELLGQMGVPAFA